MKAIYKDKAGPGASFLSVAQPELGPDEILIKVHRASICGSDLPIYHWTSWAPKRVPVPMVFGHEFCGTVVESGSAARGFKKGDFVSVESHVFCGLCYQCRNGDRHICQKVRILGMDGPGGFAELAAIPARCAWLHEGKTLRDIGSLLEPFGNAVYSVLIDDVSSRSVLVAGCGPQGLFSIAVAKASGAGPIIAVEGSKYRAGLARKMGAAAVVDPSTPNLLDAVLKAGKVGKACDGYDVVLEMSGSPAAISLALKVVKNGGRITAFGIPSKKIELDWANDIIFKGVRIHGVVGRRIFETWFKTDQLLRSGQVDISPVVTHIFAMKDFKKGFDVMSSPDKKCGKVVLVP